MSLPNDIARCAGHKDHDQCRDCQRRTDRPESGRVVHMSPPDVAGKEVEFYYHGCSYYIEPEQEPEVSDLQLKAWHIENLIEAEPDAQVVLLVDAQEAIRKVEQERDKIESALKKMISMYLIDDYIHGEDRENKIEDIFRRMMEAQLDT